MDAIVTISGGGIIGNYISSRLNNLNIKCVVVEKIKRFSALKVILEL